MLKTLATVTGTALLTLGMTQTGQAGTLYNGWTYSIDAFDDGSGGEAYEIKGLAVKETTDAIIFSIAGGADLGGVDTEGPTDGNIGWGDLMLNFSGEDYNTAADRGALFGIRFADTNDSGVGGTGLYKVSQAVALYADNNGYGSLRQYYDAGFSRPNTMGDIATEQAAFDYFGELTEVRSNIGEGQPLGALTLLTDQEAAAAGLDFAAFDADAPYTHTVSVDRDLLPKRNFIASIFLECINDGVALFSDREDVPEPSAVGGLIAAGLMVARHLRCRG